MKITITDCDHRSIDIENEVFLKVGMKVELKNAKSEEEVIEQCKGSNILIVQYAQIGEKVFKAMPELKYVVRYGVGLDTIDIEAATRYGVQIGNVPDYGMSEVADHAIALLLALKRKIITMNSYTKSSKWDYQKAIPIHRFSAQTVGVVGLGRIGRCFAERAHALGFNIIGFDPYCKDNSSFDYVKLVSFEELVEKSDAISIHCPADGNIDLFNKEVFKKMKNNAVIINVARGGIINEEDLNEALINKEIDGAGIDCVKSEPMPFDYDLFKNDNLIITPHMAWYSEEGANELKRKVAEESVRFANGEKIHYPVNRI